MTDRERRSSRREERRARAGTQTVGAVKPLVNKLPLTEVLSSEGVETIHRASMRLLQDPGILIIDYPPARETFLCTSSARPRRPSLNWPAIR
jgi:trimethylamine:corrinoid methyltransferase-like protein